MKAILSALGTKLRQLLPGRSEAPKPDEGWKARGESETGGGAKNSTAKPGNTRPSDVGSTTSSSRRPTGGAPDTVNKKKTSDDKKKTSIFGGMFSKKKEDDQKKKDN